MKKILLVLLSCLVLQTGFSQETTERNFKSQFEKYGVDGCFVLCDETYNEFIKYNPGLCDSGYIPASTFKIPHSLIALEEGIVRTLNQLISIKQARPGTRQ
jgi:beta-lactamase class D